MPKVAVHIVSYNSASSLPSCFEGLVGQSYPELEVLLIDNASSDESAALAQAAGYRVILNAENKGYAAAHNQAIATTQSDYILTLNPDVYLESNYIAAMVAALEADKRIGAAAGKLLRVEVLGQKADLIDSTGLYMRPNRRQGLCHEGLALNAAPDVPRAIFGPDGAAAFYRRAMLEDIALEGQVFDEDFFMHKEDVDICWRAGWRGWGALYVPDAIGQHVRSFRPGQRERVSSEVRFWALRNRYLLMLKNESLALFGRDLLPILSYDLAILAYVLLREHESIKAYVATWKLAKRMLHKRRLIQGGRRVDDRAMRRWFRGCGS